MSTFARAFTTRMQSCRCGRRCGRRRKLSWIKWKDPHCQSATLTRTNLTATTTRHHSWPFSGVLLLYHFLQIPSPAPIATLCQTMIHYLTSCLLDILKGRPEICTRDGYWAVHYQAVFLYSCIRCIEFWYCISLIKFTHMYGCNCCR